MKAFFSSIVLLSLFIGIIQTSSSENMFSKSAEEIKNQIVVQQRINEVQYSMQHSFENKVKEAMQTIPENANDVEKSLLICRKISELGFNVSSGCIDTDYEIDEVKTNEIKLISSSLSLVRKDYFSLSEDAISLLEPCVKFIRQENGKVIIGLNTKLDFENSINLCNSGFILEDKINENRVKNIMTTGTEIA